MTNRAAALIRAVCVVVLSIAVSVPVLACDPYECRLTVDTAQCYIRYGPDSRRFRQGTDCREVTNCNYVYSSGEWALTCSYDCAITPCYEV
jgi:hypothetical protein